MQATPIASGAKPSGQDGGVTEAPGAGGTDAWLELHATKLAASAATSFFARVEVGGVARLKGSEG
jgi:hypothetical protein